MRKKEGEREKKVKESEQMMNEKRMYDGEEPREIRS